MTREEAIKWLGYHKQGEEGKAVEVLDMAIKALEQLPKLQNRCHALTHGQICMFCPYDCENRTTAKREEE